jgi:hypothetical protein
MAGAKAGDKTDADEPQARAGDGPPARAERAVTLADWARRNQTERVDGLERPIRELVAGFVHEETQAGRRVGRPSEYAARFAAFRTRKVQ